MTDTPNSFPPLPREKTAEGKERLTGVEVEFAGATEAQTGELIAQLFGGTATDDGQHCVTISDTAFGDIHVELDITLRKRNDLPFVKEGLDAFRGVIPVEIVTPPLSRAQIEQFDTLCPALSGAGAMGSRSGVLLGFGVHLNPEVVAPDDRFTLDTIIAYAMLEPWLRMKEEIDATRRVMPFVETWPKGFVSALAGGSFDSLADVMHVAAQHVASRSQSLDLLPLFKHAEPDLFDEIFDIEDKTSPRPTFHFRLPDSRIDEAGWSLLQAWQLWRQVECVAANADLLDALRAAWATHDAAWFSRGSEWIDTVDRLLDEHAAKVDT